MTAAGAARRIIDGEAPLKALETEELFLRARRDDAAARERLRAGEAILDSVTLSGGPDGVWSQVPPEDRRLGLGVNSLRFLDPLRREGSGSEDAQTWLAYVRGWCEWAATARAAGWDSFLPAGQRAVVLAAGLESLWPRREDRPRDVVELLGEHLEVFTEKLRSGRVHLVEETVTRGAVAMAAGPHPDEHVAAVLSEFAGHYLDQGLAPAGGIGAVTTTTRRWVSLYERLHETLGSKQRLTTPGELRDRSEHEISQLWIHGTVPTGELITVGADDAQASWGAREARTSAERYSASGSDQGEATNDLLHVHRSGWAFARRGWGETELDFDKETFFALRSGRLESPGREADNSAIWLTARGVTWLGDRPSNGDSSWSDRGHHTSVEIDGRYRTLSDAELIRERTSLECFDLEVRDRAYLPTALTRRVVYSRSGDFLVVVDQSRSADEHSGRQNWTVPPGCEIEVFESSAQLTVGDEACRLVWLSAPGQPPVVEELGDGWRRISVGFAAASTRLITAVIPMGAREDIDCWRIPMENGALSISLRRPRHAEQLMITKEGAGTGSVEENSEALAERVSRAALTGGLSPEAEEKLRRAVRSRLAEVKTDLHSSGAGPERRAAAVAELKRIAEENGVAGLRDFGLGAALIDVASDDLRQSVESHPLVAGRKRTPLISWDKARPLVHEFYGVPIRTCTAVTAEIDPTLERQMLTIDYGQLVLPLLLSTLEKGRTLRVMFHGATDRSRNALPRFERMRSMETGSSGPVLFISDPCLDLDASQILTWYAGDEKFNLHEQIARQVEAFADALGCDRILYIGNSGGGGAALQCASYSERSAVVTFNPQIQVDRYVPRIARTAQEGLFGKPSVAGDPQLCSRMDLIARYREIGFAKRVFFIQNTGDEMHYEHHFKPFSEAWEAGGRAEDFKAHTPYLGPGHRVPPPHEYMELVRQGEEFVFGD